MSLSDWAESFTIFDRYEEGEPYPVCAGHDKISVCCVPPEDMIQKDVLRLKQLHWNYSDDDVGVWYYYT